jgi:hypothetical protein
MLAALTTVVFNTPSHSLQLKKAVATSGLVSKYLAPYMRLLCTQAAHADLATERYDPSKATTGVCLIAARSRVVAARTCGLLRLAAALAIRVRHLRDSLRALDWTCVHLFTSLRVWS